MEYKYCNIDNFEHFASGRVLYNKSGLSNFPVRLAQEIYSRCLKYSKRKNNISIYDPCCGGGYLLTVLGFLNHDSIIKIMGSDIDGNALKIAEKNLLLLTDNGLKTRGAQIEESYNKFHRDSYIQAMKSINVLSELLNLYKNKPDTALFKADVLEAEALIKNDSDKADIVFTDVPYGELVSWKGSSSHAIDILLDNITPLLKQTSILAMCSDKQQKINNAKYVRLEKQLIGKRKFEILALK